MKHACMHITRTCGVFFYEVDETIEHFKQKKKMQLVKAESSWSAWLANQSKLIWTNTDQLVSTLVTIGANWNIWLSVELVFAVHKLSLRNDK